MEVIAIPPDNSCRIVPERRAVCLIRCLVDHSEPLFVTINDYGDEFEDSRVLRRLGLGCSLVESKHKSLPSNIVLLLSVHPLS